MMHQKPFELLSGSTSPQLGTSPTSLPANPVESLGGHLADSNSVTRRPTAAGRGFNPRSCNTCRRRKVKCDKVDGGCGNCVKAHIECVYPGPGRAPRRPKSGMVKGSTERETELLKRLRRLEGVVEELSGQVELETIKPTSGSAKQAKSEGFDSDSGSREGPVRVVGMDEGTSAAREQWANRMMSVGGGPPKPDILENETGKLVIDEGKSRYVSNSFWARFNGEVDNIREMFEEIDIGSEEEDEESSPGDSVITTDSSDHHSFVMGYSSSKVDLRSLHPLPSQIPFYWETFKENVDPLCKILHIPTMTKTMKEVKNNLGSLSRSTEESANLHEEALCFAIYFATIVSMTEEEVKSNFDVEKIFLINRYRFATEQALARAGFLQTSEIVTVQAFVLFLVVVRRFDDSKFVWTLTGLVIRIAQSLGLHRDGTVFKLSPFDTEMRRRCWWQICTLDVRSAEDYGSDPTILEFSYDTLFPLNINDADIDAQSTEAPAARVGVSEMTFCLIRYEICHTSRKLSYVPPGDGPCKRAARSRTLAEKEEVVKELHERLESKYLVFCTNAGPLYWVTATVARLIVAKMGLIIYSPHISEGLPQSVKDRLFIASIEIMEYSQLLEREVSTKKWGWLFHTYVQWHAIAFILGEICARPHSDILDRGWRAVDSSFSGWDDAVKHSKNGMLWTPMRKLMAKARKKREDDMKALQTAATPSLQFSTPMSSTPELFESTPGYEQIPEVTSNYFADVNLDPIRPLRPGLPPGGQWNDIFPGTRASDMENLAMGQAQQPLQSHLQEQFQQHSQQPIRPWILDDSALVDLDMNALDNIEGWDDMADYFQMELDPTLLPDARPRELGSGYGSWL